MNHTGTSIDDAPRRSDVRPLLRVSNLAVDATTRQRTARLLSDVTLEVAAGSTLGVVGESGSGKSLTALSVMGLLPSGLSVASGTIGFQDQNLVGMDTRSFRKIRGSRVGMIFQDPQNSLNPAYTIGSQLIETIRVHDESLSRSAAKARAVELLERVGIGRAVRRLGDYPHQFSGGMAQRVMIALAISCEPSLLIADEPTTALDVTVQLQILSLLRSIQVEMDMTLVLISHDLSVIAQMADDVAVMYAGEVVEYGNTAQVFRNPQHPYTAALLGAQPDAKDNNGRLSVIRGTVPDAGTVLTGCKFRDRCDHAAAQCVEAHPELVSEAGSSVRCLRASEITLSPVATPELRGSVTFTKPAKDVAVPALLTIEAVSKAFRLG
ncbi:MAG TPA: ABC transporter ATP-binding protein, partial [Ilumatobacter sp.]|nr:ABC transporter ATP-binding protein [Ilumatobacter sp.]